MKRIIYFTIVLLSIVVSMSSSRSLTSGANAAAKESDYINDCKDLKPGYNAEIDLTQPYENTDLNFRIAFEKARTQYHKFMECVFEKAVEGMLKSSGSNTSGIFGANAPNLPEWMKPESACQTEKTLTGMLVNGSPAILLNSLLEQYNKYTDYLQRLFDTSQAILRVTDISKLEEAYANNQQFQRIVEGEVQDALVAMDGAFVGLKEMRRAFTMHVHFQCMLKNLEFYRHALENVREVVSALPPVIENASMHK